MWQQLWKLNIEHNTLYIVLAVIVAAFLFSKYASMGLAKFCYKFIAKLSIPVDKDIYYNLLIKPLQQFLLWLVIILAIEKLHLTDVLRNFPLLGQITVGNVLHFVFWLVGVFVFCRFIIAFINYVAAALELRANQTQSQGDNQLVLFFKDFFKVIVVIIGILLLLKFGLRQHIGTVLTGLSIVGAAIALATKESLENLIASFIIFFDKPFIMGDEVKVNNVHGTVERIGLRSTRIRTATKTFVTVPNKQMVDSIVDNQSERTKRKGSIHIELQPATSIQQIQDFKTKMNEYLLTTKHVIEYKVWFDDFTKNALKISIDFNSSPQLEYATFIDVKEKINLKALQIMADCKISQATNSI